MFTDWNNLSVDNFAESLKYFLNSTLPAVHLDLMIEKPDTCRDYGNDSNLEIKKPINQVDIL